MSERIVAAVLAAYTKSERHASAITGRCLNVGLFRRIVYVEVCFLFVQNTVNALNSSPFSTHVSVDTTKSKVDVPRVCFSRDSTVSN